MEIKIEPLDNIKVVKLSGEIDAEATRHIEDELTALASPSCRVLIDLSGVPYMSSAALRVLLSTYRQISDNQGRVALVGLSERLRDIMNITGFLAFFIVYPDINSGVRALQNETH